MAHAAQAGHIGMMATRVYTMSITSHRNGSEVVPLRTWWSRSRCDPRGPEPSAYRRPTHLFPRASSEDDALSSPLFFPLSGDCRTAMP